MSTTSASVSAKTEAFAKGEMVSPHVTYRECPAARGDCAVAKCEIARAVIEKRMPARLRFQREREGRIASDVDALDGIHLDGDGEWHAIISFSR